MSEGMHDSIGIVQGGIVGDLSMSYSFFNLQPDFFMSICQIEILLRELDDVCLYLQKVDIRYAGSITSAVLSQYSDLIILDMLHNPHSLEQFAVQWLYHANTYILTPPPL
jgi:hypothetical protein